MVVMVMVFRANANGVAIDEASSDLTNADIPNPVLQFLTMAAF
jgi:hypothetical protein